MVDLFAGSTSFTPIILYYKLFEDHSPNKLSFFTQTNRVVSLPIQFHVAIKYLSMIIACMHKSRSIFLSKSQFTRGLQCHKSLWLLKNRPELRVEPDASLQARFDAGTGVGLLAQQLFPGGMALEYGSGISLHPWSRPCDRGCEP